MEEHQTLDTDDTIYSKRFGREIFDKLYEEMEVQYDYDGNYSTIGITEVSIQNEYYESDEKEVVVIY